MKGKFSLMGRVAIALVLALSLVLVMAVPVAAARVGEPTVTLDAYKVGVAGDYSIAFTTHDELASGDTISVVFPTDTDLTTYDDGNVTVDKGGNVTVTSEAVQGQRVDILLGATCAAGAVTVAFTASADILNPSTAGTYQLQVYTSLETTARTSKDYTVYLRTTNTPASVAVVTDTSGVAGTESAYTVTVTLGANGNITYGQSITIDFPVGTTVPGIIATSDVTVEGVEPDSVVVSDLEVTIGIALGEVIPDTEPVTVVFALGAGLVNPEDAGAYTVDAWTSVETVVKTSTGYTITAEASADITQLVFSTFPTTTAYDTNASIVVQAQDQYGNLVTRSGEDVITINFTTSNTATGTLSPATADMGTNANSVSFNYKDTVSGATITAAVDAGETVVWADAVGTFIITPQVALLHGAEPVANFNTITLAIAAAVSGDTIEVEPGTYVENLIIGVTGLTLESTDGRDVTIIDSSSGSPVINIPANDVTFKGFTVAMDDAVANVDGIWIGAGTEGVEVKDNTVTGASWTAIVLLADVVGANISGNLISHCNGGIILNDGASGCTVSTNEITDCGENGAGIDLEDTTSTTITGNTVSNGGWGIYIGGNITTSCVISDNTLTGNRHDGIKIETGVTTEVLSITLNRIIANEEDGIFIATGVTWDTDNVINNNDIYGNGLEGDPLVEVAWLYDIENSTTTTVDATNNYWGDPSGPGDNVTTYVDYSPWLDAAYPDGDPVSETTITLVAGWNLISLPLLPTDPIIGEILAGADVTIIKASYRTGGPAGIWLNYISGSPGASDLITMNDGKGYWIDASAGGTLTITGVQFALPGQVPPVYDVVEGWNLIGYTGSGTPTISAYLGDVFDTVQAMYWYDAAASIYVPVTTGGDMAVGKGYWLAVSADGKIFP